MTFDIDEKQAKRERRERVAAMCLQVKQANREKANRERRERIAAMCMQGLLAYSGERFTSPNQVAGLAIECADALIAELDKEQSQ